MIRQPLFTGMFFVRLAIVCFGLLVAAPGWYAWIHGNYWFTVFNPKIWTIRDWTDGHASFLRVFDYLLRPFLSRMGGNLGGRAKAICSKLDKESGIHKAVAKEVAQITAITSSTIREGAWSAPGSPEPLTLSYRPF